MRGQSLGREDPPEEGMATHASILAWRIPWTEEPGGLQSIVSQRVRHDSSGLTLALAEYTNRQSHVLNIGIYSDYNGEFKKKN